MTKIKLSAIEYRDVSTLIEYSNNAKLHPEAQIDLIANSIAEFGFLDPVAIDEQNIILTGHGRLAAAKKLGLKEIPVIQVFGLVEAQKKAYRIASNKLNLKTGLDEQAIALELEALQELGFDLELTGFDVSELDKLLEQAQEEDKSVTLPVDNKDIDEDEMRETKNACPSCGFCWLWVFGLIFPYGFCW